jgi:mono/diheme cytochrome c family protein
VEDSRRCEINAAGAVMKKILRWLGIGLGALVGLLLVAAIVIFAMSEFALRKEHRAEAELISRPTPAQLADAPRQARILGCVSCHGEGLSGKVMFDAPGVARVFAPNLTQIAAKASDQQLAAAIRQGIRHDGRSLFVMPSPMYSHLSGGEVAALIAWIRTLRIVDGGTDPVEFGPIGRFAIVAGSFKPAPALVEEYRVKVPIDLGPEHAVGRHLASTICSECHGPALFGQKMPEGSTSPDLSIAAGYGAEQFKTLMRTGNTPAGNKLGLMKEVSVNDLRHLTDAEIEALHRYLQARAKKLGS